MATSTVGSAPATTTYNIDVASIVRRWNRIVVELDKSQSSAISFMMPFDLTRASSYLQSMTDYQAFVVSLPILDCPETGPMEMPLPSDPTVAVTENDSLYDMIQLAMIARDEVKNSQSARLPTNLVSFDYTRQQAYILKLTQLIGFISTSPNQDLPESSPMAASTGPGNRGV